MATGHLDLSSVVLAAAVESACREKLEAAENEKNKLITSLKEWSVLP